MPWEEFIITVFCGVERRFWDVTQAIKLRLRGHPPRLSDTEVITMESVGEFLGYHGDKALWEYFRRPWGGVVSRVR